MSVKRRDVLLRGSLAAAAVVAGTGTSQAVDAQPLPPPMRWDRVADVVVIGSGASGLPAAITAREAGCTVIVLEAEPHTGGHAICSGGNVPLGGGTSRQRKYGVDDSPDLVYRDLTDWSVVESNGYPDYRYNDREIIRAFADNSVDTFDFLVAHGVVFVDKAPDGAGGEGVGNSVPRENHAAAMDWPMVQTGAPADPAVRATLSTGNGLMRPLDVAARKAGVQVLLEHKAVTLFREPHSGRVVGVAVDHAGKTVNVRARKAVIVASGGMSTNVNLRRMFDPRLTEEYCGVAGMPYSKQDGTAEMAAMAVGASLWGLANQTLEFGPNITKPGTVGSQFGYVHLQWKPGSPVWDKARATGLVVRDWQNVVLVNMLGKRFYDETGSQFSSNDYDSIDPYVPSSYRNAKNVKYNPNNFINAALAGVGDGHNGGGPIWAIFDADAVTRETWQPHPPNVDIAAGFFFRAESIAELARAIVMPYQRTPMPADTLEATVARYNTFVEAGVDDDFGKPKPLYKIAKPPFYAAWATPVPHDTRAGLRINGKGQVMDMHGAVVAGLYSCGESAGGFSLHGLARATCQGRISGRNAAAERA